MSWFQRQWEKKQQMKRLEIIKRDLPLIYENSVGRTFVCDDGIARKVEEIYPSYAHRDRVVINEKDPESKGGHFLHMLSFVCQSEGNPLPDREAMEAASRLWNKTDSARAGQLEDRLGGPKSKLKLELD